MRIKVYGAGKTEESDLWKVLISDNKDIEFTNSWPFFHGKVEDHRKSAVAFWTLDEAEIREADCVLLHKWDGEYLYKGALVEVGMAIAMNKIVVVVGEWPEHSTWQFHPMVIKKPTLGEALTEIRLVGWILWRNYNAEKKNYPSIEYIRRQVYDHLHFNHPVHNSNGSR